MVVVALLTALWFLMPAHSLSQTRPQDTQSPNQFQFSSDCYFASKGTTNATVTVNFYPGNSSYIGSINYATQDGTAVANRDYMPVSGTLNFNGQQSFAVICVPVLSSGQASTNKTIQLQLTQNSSDPNAIVSRPSAVLQINLPPPPNLSIQPGGNGAVTIWWTDDGTRPVLEKCQELSGGSWSGLYNVTGDGNGHLYCTEVMGSPSAYYRLHRGQ